MRVSPSLAAFRFDLLLAVCGAAHRRSAWGALSFITSFYGIGVQRIIEGIRTSAFVIADVSEVKPNVFYELGFTQGFGKQVIVTARKGTTLPFDISDVPVIFWHGQENLKEQLRKRIGAIAPRPRR
jgi:hypothetical protein